MNNPLSNEFTHPDGDEAKTDPAILAERVRFDLIAKTESGHELRVWTDGERVVWQDDEGRSGYMPACLFRLAAHQLAHYCEDVARGDDGEQQDNFDTALHDSLSCAVDLAMAHPYWAQPDHEANQLQFGFAAIASNMAMDVQPDGLKPRDGLADDRCKQCGKRCPNATCPACQEANVRKLNLPSTSEIFEPGQ